MGAVKDAMVAAKNDALYTKCLYECAALDSRRLLTTLPKCTCEETCQDQVYDTPAPEDCLAVDL